MNLTPAQNQTLKTDVEVTHAAEFDGMGDIEVAQAYNLLAAPDFWVVRTSLLLREIYEDPSPDATLWDWNIYIARSVAEKAAWTELFSVREDRSINPSRPNIAPAISNIFSGAGGLATRTHLTAMARRQARRIERLFATGTGSTASPGTLVVEGFVTHEDISIARQS